MFGDWFKCPFACDKTGPKAGTAEEPKKTPSCKICCACPSTKAARDDCIIRNGAENCREQIEAHYTCLLSEGFSEEQVNKLRERSARA